ncbi:MAG: hypothetical protein QHH43_01890 [Candidatus Saccharicenans sp.]|jgi:hypothetical protein|uniref:Uncharacterized protein n=1 Tax=Candidatus Saccharicenans subterraneus TaxID=2508984 RepID=A0A3E2BP51_9BACT|nr:hypothetical protein [Candidatus Saccharicenans sp.]MDH7574495.1 hypothetical protein [Candidatus Saccharicenans sp.]NPV82404.1 hypothetical protein [Candidatus Aminicenantes bacterium]RFT16509.1 MAG: hypothetical protein OP8BY_1687 [Candidatus Saccharicenans subterraneum]
MILESHLFTMIIYAFLVSLVLALIRRPDLKSRLRYGLTLFLIMTLASLAFGWFMYLFVK